MGSTDEILGDDVIVNGTFDTDTSGWGTVRCTIDSVAGGLSGNCLEMTDATGADDARATQSFTTVAGKVYKVTGYVKDGTASGKSAGFVTPGPDSPGVVSTSEWVQITHYFTATGASSEVAPFVYIAELTKTILWDNISVKEVSDDVTVNLYAGTDNGILSIAEGTGWPDNPTYVSELIPNGTFDELLGSEIIANSDFSSALSTGWITSGFGDAEESATAVEGKATLIGNNSTGDYITQNDVIPVDGKTYKLVVDIDSITGNCNLNHNGATGLFGGTLNTAGVHTYYFESTLYPIDPRIGVDGTVVINSFSLKEVIVSATAD